MMHVALDGKRYFLNASGLGRYSRTLVHSLLTKEFENQIKLTLYRPQGQVRFEAKTYSALNVVTAQHWLPGDLGNGYWRFQKLPSLIAGGNFSLFHGPSHVLPLKTRCPTVVTMFDLIFLRFPAYFRLWDRNYYRYIFKKSVEQADHIISISQATKADLIHFMGVKEEKITVIYPAFDDVFVSLTEPNLSEIKKKYTLPEHYILYVGTIEPRKNILRVAQAFEGLMSSGKISKQTFFLIVGGKGWFYKDILAGIDALSHKNNIRFLGSVFGQNLAGIYQLATVMAYPSLFEGFGYPVLEAMRLGTPVLTSCVSSLPEAAGDAAVLVEPEHTDDIASGLEKIINDETFRQHLVQKGYQHAAQFTPSAMARQTMDIYKLVSS